MEEIQVKLILNLKEFPPADVLEDIIEEEVFQLRDYLLRNPIVSVLFHSRIRKLAQLSDISNQYLDKNTISNFQKIEFGESTSSSIVDELRKLETRLAAVRIEMSKTLKPDLLSELALQMISVQTEFESSFIALFEKEYDKGSVDFYPVKAAGQLDTGLVLGLFSNSENEKYYPLLEKEYNRIRKIK